MTTFVLRLIGPRPDFAMTMSDEERQLMGRHADHWRPRIEAGEVVVFGPVADGTGSWGLSVAEVEDEAGLRAFAAQDPTVLSGQFHYEIGTLLTGFVRAGRPDP
jgi:uncharacterized protein YciI